MSNRADANLKSKTDIAVVGMAGRFPGARNVEQFWRNLREGVESITFFTDEELEARGVGRALLAHPNYVKASSILEDMEMFDAGFFGYSPRDAEIMDPQQRIFLECAWEAMEDAGYNPSDCRQLVGAFGGASASSYIFNLLGNHELMSTIGVNQALIANDKDFLTTRVSYKLNFEGPSVVVQSACSTSLVAVHFACQSLLGGECDMALAGGVSVHVQNTGYLYTEESILSPDGHCRAFDEQARGTIGGSGVGIVVLKRLEDAIRDGDHIRAVIKGSAVNNDGSQKVGYTAPRVEGQARAIRMAQMMAEVEAETISYVEAHGTGTPLGDPIEVAALTRAFRHSTPRRQFCAIGSVKTNVGHLDAAAGVTGLIKAVLAMEHGELPPSLHYERPNPRIEFGDSPFYVNARLKEWERGESGVRRAGVSSFGIGGTNAHVVLEEAPEQAGRSVGRGWEVLTVSARSEKALGRACEELSGRLAGGECEIGDAAWTLQVGRAEFVNRRAVVCREAREGAEELREGGGVSGVAGGGEPQVVFMFPGGGAQHLGMARGLYDSEPSFRSDLDSCRDLLLSLSGQDLCRVIYPEPGREAEAEAALSRPSLALPALFSVEYALARLWMSWGVRASAMIGHSLGEYAAACLSGVLSVGDALRLVWERGRLFERLPAGAMLSVGVSEEEGRGLLREGLWLAAVNGPSSCVLSGEIGAVETLERELAARDVESRRVKIDVAAHSGMLDGVLGEFAAVVGGMKLGEACSPLVSNVTGAWLGASEASEVGYWVRHLRETVRFADGLGAVLKDEPKILLEVGPGKNLSTFAWQQTDRESIRAVITSLPHPQEQQSSVYSMLYALSRLWVLGVKVDWNAFNGGRNRRRIPLPTYPFERQRYWVEPRTGSGDARAAIEKRADVDDWFYAPSWKRSRVRGSVAGEKAHWLVLKDECGVGASLVSLLEGRGEEVVSVTAGESYARMGERSYSVNPARREDYESLFEELESRGISPRRILHLWGVTGPERARQEESADDEHEWAERYERCQRLGFHSLLKLAQSAGERLKEEVRVLVVTDGAQEVSGREALRPEKATALGPCLVAPREYARLRCRGVDIEAGSETAEAARALAWEASGEWGVESEVVAYRGGHRWVQTFEPLRLEDKDAELRGREASARGVREEGVYVITGGLGGVGLAIAEHLARSARARLVLVGRTPFPERGEWEGLLARGGGHDPLGRKIKKLLELEEAGARVLTLDADVADVEQMQSVAEAALANFGAVHGVVHAAGLPGGGMIQLKEEEASARNLEAKVKGARVLARVFKEHAPDFILLCSSLNSVVGSLGQADYTAANAYLDAFAAYQARVGGPRTISVNWDRWQGLGMAVTAAEMHRRLTGEELTGGMTAAEGVDAFARIVAADVPPQVAVSTRDLRAVLTRANAHRPAEKSQDAAGGDSTPSPSEAKKAERRHSAKTAYPRPPLGVAFVAPRDETERAVADIWEELLAIDGVGVHDDFSELGGHSLLATQVVSRMRQAFGVELTLRGIFETPTVAALADKVKAAGDAERRHADSVIPRARRDAALPLSYAQQRLWFVDRLEPGSAAYNVPASVRLRGRLDVAALGRALSEIVRRHEALRTTFAEVDGLPVQLIADASSLELPVVDLSTLPAAMRVERAQALAAEEARRPFDLSRGPLLRASLLRLGEEEHVLLFTTHHIVSDGWSMGVLVREVAALYGAFLGGEPSPLSELPVQYADFASWQREWLQGEALERQLGYWTRQLGGAPALLELPTDRPRPSRQTFRGAHETFLVPKEVADSLSALGQREGVTMFVTLLAAFKVLLARYAGQEDLSVGIGAANRPRVELEGLIGLFVNTLVLRTDLSGDPTFRELLARVKKVTFEAFDNQDVPFESLVEALQPVRDPAYTPLFQVMFVLQNAPTGTLELPGLRLSPFGFENVTAKFDLYLSMTEGTDGIAGSFEYNLDLYETATVRRMAQHLCALLADAVANPDREISRLSFTTHEESRQLIYAFNEN